MYCTSNLTDVTEQSNILEKSSQIVFIDRQLADYELLAAGVRPEFEVYLLDPALDGVQQVTRVLGRQKLVQAIHLVSHGSSGRIQLGSADLSLESIDRYGQELQQWSAKLAANATLSIYGCEVGKGDRGVALVYRLSEFLGISVAATQTKTGSAALDANWELELSTGQAPLQLAFSESLMELYPGVMIDGTAGDDSLKGDNNLLDPVINDVINDLNGNVTGVNLSSSAFQYVASQPIRNDFDNDGKTDILWRNSSTGQAYIYQMNGLAIAAEGAVRTVSFDWQIAGTGDFNGNNKSDILWRNQTTGETYIYQMDGSTVINEGGVRTVSLDWQIAGTGDFNGDNKSDILWRNQTTGETYIYQMNGFSITSEKSIRTVNTNWVIEGVDDFNGDSKSDILWRNSVTGQAYIYQMDGLAITNESSIGEPYTTADHKQSYWSIAGTGDYNGDSKADILWRHTDGTAYVWNMDGFATIGEGAIRQVNNSWQIVERPNQAPTVIVNNPVAVSETTSGTSAPVTVTIANQVSISDPDQNDVKKPYAGGLAFKSSNGSLPTGINIASLFTIDVIEGTINYNRQAFSYLAQGETVTATFAFNSSSGPDTLPENITLSINGLNEAPRFAHQTLSQTAIVGTPLSLTLPADIFIDPDQSDILKLTATQGNGSALPSWLIFDATSRTFTGTPPTSALGNLAIVLTATDLIGATATDTFNIAIGSNVNIKVPTLNLDLADQKGEVGHTQAGIVTLDGTTSPNKQVRLFKVGSNTPIAQTLSDTNGVFFFSNVALDAPTGGNASDNKFFAIASDQTTGDSSTGSTIDILRDPVAGGSSPNAAISWNRIALESIKNTGTTPEFASRALAMESLAVYNALAAIQGKTGYQFSETATPNTSIDAAIAQAAHNILVYLFPNLTASLDRSLQNTLTQIPDGVSKNTGITLGVNTAAKVIALRQGDGWNTNIVDSGSAAVGQWRPTAPNYALAQNPQWANLTPFTLNASDQFLPVAPPTVGSAQWVQDVLKTQQLGSSTSTTRTAEQAQIAKFWANGVGTYTPPGQWNDIADTISQSKSLGLADSAKLLLELNLAEADAAIAAWNSKFTYNSWRPVTVFQQGYKDANGTSVISSDPNWESLIITPPFPEYVSGHSTFSAAAATVLTSFFGNNLSFNTTSTSLPGVTFEFNPDVANAQSSFWSAANQAGESRIYGGIHFEFSNQAGLSLGSNVGEWVLSSFDPTKDTQAPLITITTLDGIVGSAAPQIDGFITDNLTGVAKLTAVLDTGSLKNITFGADSSFHIDVASLLASGSTLTEGRHNIGLLATDAAGNTSNLKTFNFATSLRRSAFTLASNSLQTGGTLTAASLLDGSINIADGNSLTALSYQIDGGILHPIAFNTTGNFSTGLDLSNLNIGTHTITLSATDKAGITTTKELVVSLPTLPPLTIASLSPIDTAMDIGVTYRPRIVFSRAIDPATLTSDSFYATNTTGTKVLATIVPLADNTGAWLLFNAPLPGASTITLHVDGSKIRAVDGSLLDAAGSGQGGSILTDTFTTVATAGVPGTTLTGIVVDPGSDLTPMTPDDVKAGPNGLTDYANDIFKLPIAHAKVYILGHESEFVYTDANGNFNLTNVPAGNVKVAIDGRTATNAPAGYFFPEMVMDVNIQPGVANTVMGGMGERATQIAHAKNPSVYLPRIDQNILTAINPTGTTTVTATALAGSTLTADQVSRLKLIVEPGSLVDANGNPVANPTVGISTVPPQIVMDMLPPGVLQHSFDITIQAPGGAVFTKPATLILPNVQNLAPGSKSFVLSFDHTTGRLVIDGTATVSADGLTVMTDPGSGIIQPGWHAVVEGSQADGRISRRCGIPPKGMGPTAGDFLDLGNNLLGHLDTINNVGELLNRNSALPVSSIYTSANSLLTDKNNIDKDFDEILKPDGASTDGYGSVDTSYRFIMGVKLAGDIARTAIDSFGAIVGNIPLLKDTSLADEAKLFGLAITATDTIVQWTNGGSVFQPAVDIANKLLDSEQLIKPTAAWQKPPHLLLPDAVRRLNNTIQTVVTNDVGRSGDLAKISIDLTALKNATPTIDGNDPSEIIKQRKSVLDAINGLINSVQHMAQYGYASVDARNVTKAIQDMFDAYTQDTGMVIHSNLNRSQPVDPNTPIIVEQTDIRIGTVFYAAMKNLSDGSIQRFQFNPEDGIHYFLQSQQSYRLTVYDPESGEIGEVIFESARSGLSTDIPSPLMLPDTSPAYANGLTLEASYVVGILADLPSNTSPPPTRADNLLPGSNITDLQVLQRGLLNGSRSFQSNGIIASASLQGEATAVVLSTSGSNSASTYAYLATGSYGLAIVDVTNSRSPIVLGQIKLSGNATSIAVDTALNLAAVALGSGGVDVIDVSNPTQPKISYTLPSLQASALTAIDGHIYAVQGGRFLSYDLASGIPIQSLAVGSNATVTALTIEGSTIYTLDDSKTLRIYDATNRDIVRQTGSIDLSNVLISTTGNHIFVGDGVAYIGSGGSASNDVGGYVTVNVQNSSAPTLIAGFSSVGIAAGSLALNGSGLGIGVQRIQDATAPGGRSDVVDVLNTSNPSNTGNFITRFKLPAAPVDVAIANGVGFVADGTAGLQIINYKSLDILGVPPTITINNLPTDLDPATTGIQLKEGQKVSLGLSVNDDVQVRSVELLLNGKTIVSDISYPWDIQTFLPSITANGSNQVTLQVRATDTGGNNTLSQPIVVQLVPDLTPFTLIDVSPANGSTIASTQRVVTLTFSQAVDQGTISSADITLKNAGGTLITPKSIALQGDGKRLTLVYDSGALPIGTYSLNINGTAIKDISGDALSTGPVISNFTVKAFSNSWISSVDGDWTDNINWSQGVAPIISDDVLVNTPLGATALFANIPNGSSSLTVNSLAVSGRGSLVLQSSNGGQSRLVTTGDVTNSGNIEIQIGDLSVGGALHNSGNIKINTTGSSADSLSFSAPIVKIDGGGTIALSNTLPLFAVSGQLQTGNDRLLGARPKEGQPTTTLENVDNTITGNGHIGAGSIRQYSVNDLYKGDGFINGAQGVIKATGSDTIEINSATLVNHGLIEATAADPQFGANIDFATHSVLLFTRFEAIPVRGIGVDIDNTDGLILADGTGASVNFNGAKVHGGTLQTKNGGTLFFQQWGLSLATKAQGVSEKPLLDGIANAILIKGANPTELAQVFTLDETFVQGAIQNQGVIHVIGFNSTTPGAADRTGALSLSGDVTLTGGGVINLERPGDALSNNLDVGILSSRRLVPNVNYVLTNVNNTIKGAGTIGYSPYINYGGEYGRLKVINESAGSIVATKSKVVTEDLEAAELRIRNVDLTNNGLLSATASGGLRIIDSNVLNQGILKADGGGVKVDGDVDESNSLGQVIVTNGSVMSIDGSLKGNGHNNNTISSGSVLSVGDFQNGDVTFIGSNNSLIINRSVATSVLLQDFVVNDALYLKDINSTNASFNYTGSDLAGILSVTDGVHTANLNLAFSGSTGIAFNPNLHFFLTDDGYGTTRVTTDVTIGNVGGGNGSINNTGNLKIGPSGQISNLVINQNTLLLGAGSIDLVGGSIISSTDVQASGTPVTFENSNNIIAGNGTIGDDTIDLYNNGGTIVANAGDVLIIDANSTRNTSLIQADGGSITVKYDIDDWGSQGSVKAINGGIIKIGDKLHGTGTNYISNGGTLEVDYFQDGSIIFSGANNHFILYSSTRDGQGTLANLGIGDTIDLRDIGFSGINFFGYTPNSNNTGGTLQVSNPLDGAANILLSGNYSASNFSIASDITGGTIITKIS
jgi:hypothetical protein